MQVSKYANLQVCKYANLQVLDYLSIQSLEICKYGYFQVGNYSHMQKLALLRPYVVSLAIFFPLRGGGGQTLSGKSHYSFFFNSSLTYLLLSYMPACKGEQIIL